MIVKLDTTESYFMYCMVVFPIKKYKFWTDRFYMFYLRGYRSRAIMIFFTLFFPIKCLLLSYCFCRLIKMYRFNHIIIYINFVNIKTCLRRTVRHIINVFWGRNVFMKPMKFNLRVKLRLGEDNYYLGVTGWCYVDPSCLRGEAV